MKKINPFKWFLIGCCLLISVLVIFAIKDDQEFEQFVIDHHCKLVAQKSGQVTPILGYKGSVSVMITSDEKAWQCDDGVTYWRDE